jgi:hypothetical protein
MKTKVIRSSLDDKSSIEAFLRSADVQLIRLILITRIADQSSRHSVVFQDSTSSGSRGKRVKRADRLAERFKRLPLWTALELGMRRERMGVFQFSQASFGVRPDGHMNVDQTGACERSGVTGC